MSQAIRSISTEIVESTPQMKTRVSSNIAAIAFFVSFLAQAEEVRLYSERHYDADKEVFSEFTDETGIEVKAAIIPVLPRPAIQ